MPNVFVYGTGWVPYLPLDGAAGQVPVKQSAADYDIAWQAPAAALPPSGPAGGDLSGTYPNPTVTKINGITVGNNVGVPPGSMVDFAGSSAPDGWLLCDGSAVSRVTYAALFAAIGTVWGAGDGSTTFNVPDLRSRVPLGAGTGAGLSARTLAQTGGEETHALSVAEMAVHAHTDAGHNHGDPQHNHGNTGTESAFHLHGSVLDSTGQWIAIRQSASSIGMQTGGANPGTYSSGVQTGNQNVLHVHGTGNSPANLAAANVGVQNNGGGAGHNTMPPFAVVTKIIRT